MGATKLPSPEVRPLVLMDPVGSGLVLPVLVPWWLPKLSRVGAGEGNDSAKHVDSEHSTWAEQSSSLSCRRLFQLCP